MSAPNIFATQNTALPLSQLDANFAFSLDSANNSFLQTGTGAVSRSVQSKEQDVVSVFDFMTSAQIANAKAGTPTDFTTAIQAAIDALPINGGMLLFPIGTYLISSLTISKQITIQGQGMFGSGTYILASTATGKVFNCTGSSITIRDLCIDKNVNQTGGAYVYCDTASSIVTLQNVYMLNWFRGVHFVGVGGLTINHVRMTNGVVSTGIGVRIEAGLAMYMNDVIVQSTNGSEPFAGTYVTNCGDLTMVGCHFVENIYGMVLQPGNGQVVTSVYATNCFFDNSSTYGLWVAPTNASSSMQRMTFTACWFSSSGSSGVLLDTSGFAGTIDGLEFVGCEVYANGSHGFQVQGSNTKRIKFNGGKVAQNTGNGMLFGAGVSNWQVVNATIGPIGGLTGNAARAITSLGGTSDDVLIANNELNGNTAGALNIASTGSRRRIQSNLGYNPVGPSAISVTASPFTYTAGDSPESVYITGGTVSLVVVGGITLFTATEKTVELEPGASVVVTYSAGPTMNKYVH